MIEVRRFRESDAKEVSAMIIRTLREVNIKDYPVEEIEELVIRQDAAHVLERASFTHFYVVLEGAEIIGCGAIGPYWGSKTESSLFTIFVSPDYIGRGIGRRIIETLEADPYFIRADRVEIPASITACDFYRKMGYDYKDGVTIPDEEGLYRLEKIRRAEK